MKVGVTISAIVLLSSVTWSFAAPLNDLQQCRNIYNAVIRHITSTEGEEATGTIWKLLFHDIDVDGDEKLTSSDVALFLEKENYIHESDVIEVIGEAGEWIKAGGDEDGQLTPDEFVTTVQKTIATQSESAAKYAEISSSMCHLFTNKVPHIAEAMIELETCAKHLEESILMDKSRRAEFNSWYAIFQTMDINHDLKIDFEELKQTIGHTLTDDDDISLANALGYAIYGTVHHEVKDINEEGFYVFVHELLYGVSGANRKQFWGDLTTEHDLRGRVMLCHAIRDVRTHLTAQRDTMNDCIKSYESTRQTILGADGVFAPEIVFTMVDANKDGKVSREEFDAFVGSQSTLFNVIERKHAQKDMKIKEFRSVMPDEIVEAKKSGDADAVFELTSMTSSELEEAEKLCTAIISSVEHYPATGPHGAETEDHAFIPPMSFTGAGTYEEHHWPHHEEHPVPSHETELMNFTDEHGLPLEILIHHPSEEQPTEGEEHPPLPEQFTGNGHYEWQEHTLPHEEDSTTHDTHLTPPSPSRVAPEHTGIVYHMVDADGHPIEIVLSQIEIDDIMHRMALASQEVPVEPTQDAPHPQQEEQGEDVEHNQIVQEIERILLARENGGETTTSKPATTQKAVQEGNEEEEELRKLLEDMEVNNGHH